ncbi:MAG: hypothetical protein OHK0012_27270 [Synechococcales cyanobacterium]
MNGVEKIHDHEFQDILGIPLGDGVGVFDVWDSYFSGLKQLVILRLVGAAVLVLTGALLVWILLTGQSISLYVLPLVGILVVVAIVIRTQMVGKAVKTRLGILKPGQMERATREVAAAITDLTERVNRYNDLVNQLQDSKTGVSWREFRKLTDDQRLYIQSSFMRVRGKLMGSLRVCRQQIENPGQPVGSWDKEIISRDLELKFRFALNTMTSDYYLQIVQALETLEAEIRQQISSLTPTPPPATAIKK